MEFRHGLPLDSSRYTVYMASYWMADFTVNLPEEFKGNIVHRAPFCVQGILSALQQYDDVASVFSSTKS